MIKFSVLDCYRGRPILNSMHFGDCDFVNRARERFALLQQNIGEVFLNNISKNLDSLKLCFFMVMNPMESSPI